MREQLLTVALRKAMDLLTELEKANETGTQSIMMIRRKTDELRKELNRILN